MELLWYERTCTFKLLFYCKLFTSVINRLLVYLEIMNECISGVEGSIKSSLVLSL